MSDELKNCEKLWYLSLAGANGTGVQGYFLNQEEAEAVFNRFTKLVGQALVEKEVVPLVFEDIVGFHSLRVNMFPYCTLREVSAAEITWKDINDKLKKFRRVAGTDTDTGFKSRD